MRNITFAERFAEKPLIAFSHHRCVLSALMDENTETRGDQIPCPMPTAYNLVEGGLDPRTGPKTGFPNAISKGIPRPPELTTKSFDWCWATKVLTSDAH